LIKTQNETQKIIKVSGFEAIVYYNATINNNEL